MGRSKLYIKSIYYHKNTSHGPLTWNLLHNLHVRVSDVVSLNGTTYTNVSTFLHKEMHVPSQEYDSCFPIV